MLDDSELLQIVQRQAKLFKNLPVTAAQWGGIGDLFAYLLCPSDGSLLQEELALLREGGVPQRVAQTIPDLLTFFVSYTQAMDETHVQALRSATDAAAREQILCSALSGCREAFLTYTTSFSRAAQTNTAEEQDACAAAGYPESLQEFLSAHPPLSAEALYEQLLSTAQADTTHAFLCYLRGIAPCFTYAAYHHTAKHT